MKKYISVNGEIFEATIVAQNKQLEDSMLNNNRRTGNGTGKRNLYLDKQLTLGIREYFPKILDDFEKQKSENEEQIKVYFNILNFLDNNEFVNQKKEKFTEQKKKTIELLNELKSISKNKSHFYIEAFISNAGYHGVSLKKWKQNKEYIYDVLFIDTLFNLYIFDNNSETSIYCEFFQDDDEIKEDVLVPKIEICSQEVNNVIYYGSPGTGKSYKADNETKGENVKKVTFHPDYDYHSFVGGYKPTMIGEGNNEKIAYKFVPQIFTKIYVDAWKNYFSTEETKPFYLQIEEINRGNCAEIFGDLFQLLDRDKNGFSKYEVTAEEELYKYLLSSDGFGGDHDGIKGGKLRLPSNLKIIATMNTSDQSLFPMDSAFKRRWDWIYVPIDYNCSSSDFTIQLNNGKSFEWLSFLKIINEEIFEITKSQDKQIGNWFINAQNSGKVISESTFVNKVVFYLWNDVFKDEENTIFKTYDGKNITYTSFFENGTSNNLVSYILEERLKLIDLNKAEPTTTEEE